MLGSGFKLKIQSTSSLLFRAAIAKNVFACWRLGIFNEFPCFLPLYQTDMEQHLLLTSSTLLNRDTFLSPAQIQKTVWCEFTQVTSGEATHAMVWQRCVSVHATYFFIDSQIERGRREEVMKRRCRTIALGSG